MRPIVSAKPGKNEYTYFYGKRFLFPITNSDEVQGVDEDVVQKIIKVSYEAAVINNRQLLYALIGKRCWLHEDKDLSSVIARVKEKPWAKQIINNFKL